MQLSSHFSLDQKLAIYQKFFTKSVDLLNDSSISSNNIANIILLLKDFILKFLFYQNNCFINYFLKTQFRRTEIY